MSFDALGLAPELLRAIADQGYTEPTPIQQQAIPEVLARHDIMGCAQTGTGKTASFTLPILQRLSPQQNTSPSPARHPVRALILTPTRELAAQVHESVCNYGKHMSLRSGVVYGGVDINPQIKVLRAGVEILVATPGRLLDHVQQKTVNLSRVEILVLDEADRMLDMGFMPDIKRILALLPATRQNLLFSATFSEEIRRLAGQFMRDPVAIEVARRNAPAELVTHTVFEVETGAKRALLEHLIQQREMKQVLVFTRTKRDANRLSRELEQDGIAASAIHSDRSQIERMKALEDFKQGTVHVLVATDIAARGIDIEQLPFVINYELPYAAEDYVHRIGRTGRAGCPGEAISLVDAEETRLLDDIEKLLKRPLVREPLPAFARRGGSNGSGGSGDRDRSRDRRPERERPAPAQRPAAAAAPSPAAQPVRAAAAAQPAPGGFDFSRPYEPATADAGDASPSPSAAPVRSRPTRPVAALLGGFKKT